jgi:hypothetical protein
VLLWATVARPAPEAQDPRAGGTYFLLVVGLTFVSGALGGCLYSLRGLIKHSALNDFSQHYNYWYLLSPLAGGISGIIVFFLLLGGALTLGVAAAQNPASVGVRDLALAPYIAFSLLAGYASRAFMVKMKDLADSLFALSSEDNK